MLRALGDLPGAFFVDVGNDEIRAGTGKHGGNSRTYASAGPGDDGKLTA